MLNYSELKYSKILLDDVRAFNMANPEARQSLIQQAITDLNAFKEVVNTADEAVQQLQCLVKIVLLTTGFRTHFKTLLAGEKVVVFSPNIDSFGGMTQNRASFCSTYFNLANNNPAELKMACAQSIFAEHLRASEFTERAELCKKIVLQFDIQAVDETIAAVVEKYRAYRFSRQENKNNRLWDYKSQGTRTNLNVYQFFMQTIDAMIRTLHPSDDRKRIDDLKNMKYDFFAHLILQGSKSQVEQTLMVDSYPLVAPPYDFPAGSILFYSRTKISLSNLDAESGDYTLDFEQGHEAQLVLDQTADVTLLQACAKVGKHARPSDLLFMFSLYEFAFIHRVLAPQSCWVPNQFKLTKDAILGELTKLQLNRAAFINRGAQELQMMLQQRIIPQSKQTEILECYHTFLREMQENQDQLKLSMRARDYSTLGYKKKYQDILVRLHTKLATILKSAAATELIEVLYWVLISSTLVTILVCGFSLALSFCTMQGLISLLSQPMMYLGWAGITASIAAVQLYGVFSKNAQAQPELERIITEKIDDDTRSLRRIQELADRSCRP